VFCPSRFLKTRAVSLLAPLGALALAGCGAPAFTAGTSHALLVIAAGAGTVETGSHLRLSATVAATAQPAVASWRVVGSDNAAALGSGTVAPDGTYTPPGVLSQDEVTVTLGAWTASEGEATATVTVRPAFAQPLTPENAAVPPGESVTVHAQIAEVSAGTVHWSLAAGAPGTLTPQGCTHAAKQFTSCAALYTAPSTATATPVVLSAATAGGAVASARILLRADGLSSNPTEHQHEALSPVRFGVSGGNDNDFDTYTDPRSGARFVADCCGGTLGAMVEDAEGNRFALSNNHVLAISDQGARGDTVEQPGLIDDACVPLSSAGAHVQPVGHLAAAVPLEAGRSNVDAAVASLAPGVMDSGGSILELGSASGSGALPSAPPTAGAGEVLDARTLDGLRVAKSGRTTGLTCSTVDAVDLSVRVDYFKDCAESEPLLTKTFTGQIGIGGSAFADAGDSGALVLDTANARAVGLLYATGLPAKGSADATEGWTLANPIGDVLSELSFVAGSPLHLAGSSTPHNIACLDYDAPAPGASPFSPARLSPDQQQRTDRAVEAAASLRGSGAVLAVAAGRSADNPGEGAVLLYVDREKAPASGQLPATVRGVRTVIVPVDPAAVAGAPAGWPLPTPRRGMHLSAESLLRAEAAVGRLSGPLLRAGSVLGVGVAGSQDSAGEPALLVLLDSHASPALVGALLRSAAAVSPADATDTELPPTLDGLRVRYASMQDFRVSGSKYVAPGTPSSCSVQHMLSPR
jgi:hypothetical protein